MTTSHNSTLHDNNNHTGASTRSPSPTPTVHEEPSSPRLPPTHSQDAPDLSFPYQTTDYLRAGLTNEYREVDPSGVVPMQGALYRAPTKEAKQLDLEKSRKLSDYQLVVWKVDDPEDPRNWSNGYRWYLTFVVACSVIACAFGSAIVTGDFRDIEHEFHVSEVVVALSVSLMVVGFGIGPLAWSPLSELYGRKLLLASSFWIYVIFNIPCAVAKNIGTLLVCRFFCGIFASAPLTLAGGVISDIWDNNERGFAIAIFAAAPYGGPVVAPLVGGFIGEQIGWRWLFWVNMILAGVCAVLVTIMPETYAPVLLRKRAAKMRKETGHYNIVTEQEMFPRPFSEILVETLVRPFQMLVTEPILLLMSLYISLIYGLLYAFFFSFPVVFGEGYHFSDGIVGVTFCSVLIGLALALLVTPRLEKFYAKKVEEGGGKADPEARLPGMMLGAPFVPISLFIFGWTAPPYVMPGGGNWVGPCISGIPFGFGMVVIYFAANAYLIDAFPAYVASALAAKVVVRSGMGAAMPLFITQMFHGLGNGWAASLLAFLALAICPIPFLFYKYGKSIRARSKRAA
ncbi:MFS general substrate transporter [Gloeophyllum trabeum ATCC 11539]|uniref:MFS general substrate transporter n=1 Tax=Gloeophyllum trabeum (strain ATCC 11539 / FP-39264 / Madison 617) TaxID=670483 RepID=S7QKD3_GLOTA|nr:MFS general substrate transporter [Gloeophyllum trabeum ATCC 11539]EPQ60211.1 MFS general substrate transporter [Gloeophyllum trabeum ATCC 11539]